MTNPAKLGHRSTTELRLPNEDAYPLLAGRRNESNPVKDPSGNFKADNALWVDAFGADAMVNGEPLNTAKHFANITPDNEAGMVLLNLLQRQPKAVFSTLYKDSFNGTAIAPKPFTQKFDDFGTLNATLKVENGKLDAEAVFTFSQQTVDRFGSDFLADGAGSKLPSIRLSTSADLTEDGSVENIRVMAELKDLPPVSISKTSGQAELVADLKQAIKDNPQIGENPFMELVMSGLDDAADAWPIHAIDDLLNERAVGLVAVPMERDSKLQLSMRIGEDRATGRSELVAEVLDLLSDDDKTTEVGAVGKVVAGDDPDHLVVKDLAVGNSGLLALRWKDNGDPNPQVFRTNPKTGKETKMSGREAEGVFELVTMIPAGVAMLAGGGI